jgi:TRAP-type C4-dicarboxylate transport system substrate-binding protein
MHERMARKIQKQRHMSDIYIMLLNNHLFKNLSLKDQKRMSKLIYKAELIEMHVRDKKLTRVNDSFQDMIDAMGLAILQMDEKDPNNPFGDEDDDNDDNF